MKIIIKYVLVLALALGASVGCEQPPPNAGAARATPPPVSAPQRPPATPQNPEDAMPRIRAEEAIRMVRAGEAVVIDVRGSDAYKIAHTLGALDFPLDRLEHGDYTGLPRDKRIIAYCT
jgi:hypothetical protein